MMKLLKRILLSFLALILIFEEWLWNTLTYIGPYLTRLLRLERFEEGLRNASPKVALLAFAIPLLIVTPINLFAFWLLAKGFVLLCLIIEILVKLFATFLIARVFSLTKKQLLTFNWFAVLYTKINGWLRWAHDRLVETEFYQGFKRLKILVRRYWDKIRTKR